MAFQASSSVISTGAMENKTALRIEALRLSVQRANYSGPEQIIMQADQFYKFMQAGTVPDAPKPPTTAA